MTPNLTYVRDAELVRAELESFIRGTGLWHFEDHMHDQIQLSTGERSFSAWELICGEVLVTEAFEALGEGIWELDPLAELVGAGCGAPCETCD